MAVSMNVWRTFWIGMLVIAVMFTALILATEPAPAQQGQFCDSERAMLDMLFRNYSEFPVFRGDAGQGRTLILTRADGEGSWTLLTVTNGRACISAAGPRSRFDGGI